LIARSMSSFLFGASRNSTCRSPSEDNWINDPRTAIVPRRHRWLDAFTDRRPSRETSLVVVTTQHACAGTKHVRQRWPRSVRFEWTALNEHSVEYAPTNRRQARSPLLVAWYRCQVA